MKQTLWAGQFYTWELFPGTLLSLLVHFHFKQNTKY